MRKPVTIISEKGSIVEGLLTLLALSIVIFAILLPKSFQLNLTGFDTINSEKGKGSYSLQSGRGTSQTLDLNTGNAQSSSDPMGEYIIIENRGSSPVNITGMRLENDKSTRNYSVGSQYVNYASDVGIIPQGAKIISPDGKSRLEDIILGSGERAIVVSGSPGNLSSYALTSFKENSCTGYLSETYNFPSGMEKSCVRPYEEDGKNSLDLACKKYIDSMRACHAPKYGGVDRERRVCNDCVDGTEGLTSQCTAYIKTHFSYEGCLANHIGEKNFEGKTWHVYLHRPWEMWSNDDETFYLYNKSGKLESSVSY